MNAASFNAIYSTPKMKRRYESWFLRFALADGSGAWWLRYVLLNLGNSCFGGCGGNARGFPVQVWATWFPRGESPQHYLAGFPRGRLQTSKRFASPFFLDCEGQRIEENSCRAAIEVNSHKVSWDLQFHSTRAYTMSNKGWIGFTHTPHADAIISGKISLDGQTWQADPLGFGVQGHNTGFRHRAFWTWAHALFPVAGAQKFSCFESVEYEMPLGLRFRRALLWHDDTLYEFRRMNNLERTTYPFRWSAEWSNHKRDATLLATFDGAGISAHCLPYLKTDCSGTFDVTNNSLASAKLIVNRAGNATIELYTDSGAVLEVAGGGVA